MEEQGRDGAEVWRLIEALTDDVKRGRADIAALVSRADASDARADASEARADRAEGRADEAEARADKAEARADQADLRADIGDIRVDKIAAAELVDRELIAELQADGEVSRKHLRELERALRSSRVIGVAIGMLMASRDLDEDQAFAVLATASHDSGQRLRDIAELLVRGTPGDEPSR
ncbi:ANTAR domain-containing protein [Nocardioides sp. GXQ0305]|uniref:ANTAR domain-containing protein n=1 Tax=Nocardioides sp. GXQ0305 TaxID=3423912 RepID=UPI003D7EDD72